MSYTYNSFNNRPASKWDTIQSDIADQYIYLDMLALSALYIILFFGGYNILPGMELITGSFPELLPILQLISLVTKVGLMIWFFIWVRWTLPRFRYDQLMDLGWRRLLPIGLVNLIVTVLFVYFRNQ